MRTTTTVLTVLLLATGIQLLAGCTGEPEATSLLGRKLRPIPMAPDVRAEREANLAEARAAWERAPDEEEAIIWYGRRTAYLGHYRAAIEIFSDGLRLHPESYRLLRHRGHRHLTIREIARAIKDLEGAADLIEGVPDAVEPDGLPNRLNRPTSTSHTNIYYHLGLAHYLRGDLDPACAAYRRCLELSMNDDMRCAASYWLYLTLRRMNRDEEAAAVLAPISPDLEIIENDGYRDLLLLFKGELTPEEVARGDEADEIQDATVAYGVAMWYFLEGEREEAIGRFRRIVRGPAWPAFGFIAAEAELARQ